MGGKGMKKYLNLMTLIFLILILFVSCSADESKKADAAEDLKYSEFLWTDAPYAEVDIELNYDPSYSLSEMVEKSEVIVRGKFFLDHNNGRENVFGFNKSMEKSSCSYGENLELLFSESSYMCFTVNEVLKGETDRKIYVNIRSLDVFKYEDYVFDFMSPLSTEVDIGIECFLFLNKNEETGYYDYATHPSVIQVFNNTVKLQSKIKGMKDSAVCSYLLTDRRCQTQNIIKINVAAHEINDDITGMTKNEFIEKVKSLYNEN